MTITERVKDARMNVISVENSVFASVTPPMVAPGKVNAVIATFGTNTVNRYRIIAFVTIENKPSVSMLIGKLMRFNTGLTTRSSMVSEIPAISRITMPPETSTPGRICVRRKIART